MSGLWQWLPRFRLVVNRDEQIIGVDDQAAYPTLAPDFATLSQRLLPYFRDFDTEALYAQNQFRWLRLTFLLGGATASILGAVQAALPSQSWPGVAEAAVAAVLTFIAFLDNQLKPRDRYSTNRLRAERLRAEYFQFLARVGSYTNDATREQNLIHQIARITGPRPGKPK